ncbi:bifunctional DNA-formamidopyrimidine glycosylase/DNA-(apurinic or apyrimidinic site) lyase [Candidatus Nomurabacteria bacterium]|nr:bifunctional DNA-formamidopyrimidine glycosylase/DNA-(apurinic or apyrimidinic site) lyase [Candidatus Nomurabacteria bacterium]
MLNRVLAMPELPEVETVRVQLWNKLKGKKISAVDILHPKSVSRDSSFADRLIGLKISDIDRIGKLLIFKFSGQKNLFMLAHLKMTGQFFFTDKAGRLSGGGGHTATHRDTAKFPGRHTRVAIHFVGGSTLYFNDMRLFGYLRLTDEEGLSATMLKFGPEPIADNFSTEDFMSRLAKKNALIKAVLLDQSFVAGLGNIYVDEALFKAKIRPDRRANTLKKSESARLAKASKEVLEEAIKNGGTTFQSFADTDGQAGGHSSHLLVFARQGLPCYRCKSIIEKTKVAGRGTHFCPKCQK